MTFSTYLFLRLFPAVFITLAAGTLMEMIDVSVSGWILGPEAAEAVAVLAAPITISEFESFLFSTGGTVHFLKAAAEFDTEGAHRQFGTTIVLSLLCGLLTAIIFAVLRTPYLAFINADPKITELARAYMNILLAVALVRPAAYSLNSLVYADGSPKLSAITSAIQLLVNVTVSIIFCKKYGIAGCAYGTLAGYIISCQLLLLHFLRPGKTLRTLFDFSKAKVKPIFKTGFVDGLTLLLWSFLMFGIEAAVVKIAGPEMLSATAAIWVLTAISTIFDTPGLAVQPIIENYMSDRNYRIARKAASLAARCAFAFGALVGLICVVCPDIILAIANLSETTRLADTRLAVRIIGISLPFWALSFYLAREYIFIGSIRTALIFTLLKDGILPALLACAFLPIFSVHGLWTGWALSIPLAIFITSALIWRKYGMCRVPYEIPQPAPDDVIQTQSILLSESNITELVGKIASSVTEKIDADTGRQTAELVVKRLMSLHHSSPRHRIHAEITLDFTDGLDLIISNEHITGIFSPAEICRPPDQDTITGPFRRCLYHICDEWKNSKKI